MRKTDHETRPAIAPQGEAVVWEMKYPHAMPMIDFIAASEFVRSEERAKKLVDICQRRYGEPATYRPLYATPQATAAAVDDAIYTNDEVSEAMEVLRGRHGSTALNAEVLDDIERVLTAALAAPPAEGDGNG